MPHWDDLFKWFFVILPYHYYVNKSYQPSNSKWKLNSFYFNFSLIHFAFHSYPGREIISSWPKPTAITRKVFKIRMLFPYCYYLLFILSNGFQIYFIISHSLVSLSIKKASTCYNNTAYKTCTIRFKFPQLVLIYARKKHAQKQWLFFFEVSATNIF